MMDTYDRGDVRESYEAAAASIDSAGHSGHRLYVRHESQETTSEQVLKQLRKVYTQAPEYTDLIKDGFKIRGNIKLVERDGKKVSKVLDDILKENKKDKDVIATHVGGVAYDRDGKYLGPDYVAVFEKRK